MTNKNARSDKEAARIPAEEAYLCEATLSCFLCSFPLVEAIKKYRLYREDIENTSIPEEVNCSRLGRKAWIGLLSYNNINCEVS